MSLVSYDHTCMYSLVGLDVFHVVSVLEAMSLFQSDNKSMEWKRLFSISWDHTCMYTVVGLDAFDVVSVLETMSQFQSADRSMK